MLSSLMYSFSAILGWFLFEAILVLRQNGNLRD